MRHRVLLLICVIAGSAVALAVVTAASAATRSHRGRAPVRRGLPTIAGKPEAGDVLRMSRGRWSGARSLSYRWERCSAAGGRCVVIERPNGGDRYAARRYKLTAADVGHRIRVRVRATNAWGATSATSRPTAIIKKAAGPNGSPSGSGRGPTSTPGSSPPATGGTNPAYFSTVPSSKTGSPPTGIPRPDATCAGEVTPTPENRPQNATANHSVPSDPSAITWNPTMGHWTHFVADRDHVTGDFTGTTDEILQWVACKWGIDANIVRADAVVESNWVQSTIGNSCGVAGDASYGILQVKNKDCSGGWVHGGWPSTQDDTAVDADYWGANLRACFDGAFYDGGQWLYNGQTIAEVISQHGDNYALWGCVGSWDSGNWYDPEAQSYIAKVQSDYQSKPWLQPGF